MNKKQFLLCLSIFQFFQFLLCHHLKMYCAKSLEGRPIIVAEKMQWKSHRVYPPEIIQTSLLGWLQKKSMEHNECLYAASISERSVRKPPTGHASSLQNYFQTNCLIVM